MFLRLLCTIVAIIIIALSGCANHQVSQSERAAYPLPFCQNMNVMEANVKQTTPLPFESLATTNTLCVSRPPDASSTAMLEDMETQFRSKIEEPFRRKIGFQGSPKLGLALSGGGTKAASFASGVIAGLYESGLIAKTDYISSVSGGGYAAYHLYSQLLFPFVRDDISKQIWPTHLYSDCIREIDPESTYFKPSTELQTKLGTYKYGQCRDSSVITLNDEIDGKIRNEAFVRCMQDVLDPGVCEAKSTNIDLGFRGYSVLGSIALIPASWLVNTLWDSGVRLSATAKTYHDGIGISYGSVPNENFNFPDGISNSTKINCTESSQGYVHYCEDNIFDPDAIGMTYDELRLGLLMASDMGMRLPLWIIDATSTKHRSGYGWFAFNKPSLQDVFEMTPVSHGSGRYGFVSHSADLHNLTVLDSVVTAAAFFDANEQVLKQPLRAAAGVGQHLLNLGWGIDILNYNVSDDRISYHKYTPMPFNWLDTWLTPSAYEDGMENRRRSAFIRLVDGGSSENLALHSQLKRGVRNIVVVDAAEDQKGKFADLCNIKSALDPQEQDRDEPLLYKRRFLYVPGLDNFAEVCAKGQGYPITKAWNFNYPVLLGCVRTEQQQDKANPCSNLSPDDSRLFIIKPALDEKHVEKTYKLTSHKESEEKKMFEATHCWLVGDSVGDPLSNHRVPASCDVMTYYVNNLGTTSKFPQHSTISDTADSSYTIYAAYRELARQYTYIAAPVINNILNDESEGGWLFEQLLNRQYNNRLSAH